MYKEDDVLPERQDHVMDDVVFNHDDFVNIVYTNTRERDTEDLLHPRDGMLKHV